MPGGLLLFRELFFAIRSISAAAFLTSLLVGCGANSADNGNGSNSGATSATAASGKAAHPAGSQTDSTSAATNTSATSGSAGRSARGASTANANEMGRIMVLEYHNITSGKGQFFQTPDQFRGDLQQLYDNGYATLDIHDFVTGNITTPAGKTPVVLTFDDASPYQFRFIDEGGKPVIDPNCAVGILNSFAATHPGFGNHACFFVLPNGFGQPQYKAEKYRYLVSHGYAIGNHTWTHPIMTHKTPAQVQEELGRDDADIHAILPGYKVNVLAYPFGTRPKTNGKPDYTFIAHGTWQNDRYQIDDAFLVGAEPSPSPYSTKFHPYAIPRVQAIEADLKRWIKMFQTHPRGKFVSDGDPNTVTVPKVLQAEVNPAAVSGKKVVNPGG